MSDLNPKGVPITLNDGVERHFLFTMNVFDTIQDMYKTPVINVIHMLGDNVGIIKTLKTLTMILVNDEARMKKHFDKECNLNTITEEEAGWLVDVDNMEEVTNAILEAFRISTPEADEEDEDPN